MNILSMTGVGQEVVPEYYEGSLTVGRTNVPSWAAVDYEVACVGTRQGMFVDVAVSSSARPTEVANKLNINQCILPSNTKANHFILI